MKPEEIRQIVNIMIKDVFASLEDKHIKGSMTKAAGDRLAEIGYDEKYGARPLRRKLQTMLEDQLAQQILEGKIKNENTVNVVFKEKQLEFKVKK